MLSKYTDIDIDGEWFDTEGFGPASDEDLKEINIPEHLRPNHSAFFFRLEPDQHLIIFETYSESKSLSAKSVEKYFRDMAARRDTSDRYGRIDADLVKSYDAADEILGSDNLRELQLIVRKPNTDGIDPALIELIEKRLKKNNATEFEERFKANGKDGLTPTSRTRDMTYLAAENGNVEAKVLENGLVVRKTLIETPLKEVSTYQSEEIPTYEAFTQLADALAKRVKKVREEIGSGAEDAE